MPTYVTFAGRFCDSVTPNALSSGLLLRAASWYCSRCPVVTGSGVSTCELTATSEVEVRRLSVVSVRSALVWRPLPGSDGVGVVDMRPHRRVGGGGARAQGGLGWVGVGRGDAPGAELQVVGGAGRGRPADAPPPFPETAVVVDAGQVRERRV